MVSSQEQSKGISSGSTNDGVKVWCDERQTFVIVPVVAVEAQPEKMNEWAAPNATERVAYLGRLNTGYGEHLMKEPEFMGKGPIDTEELKRDLDAMERAVNSPKHYTVGGHEAIDVIKAKLTREEFRGFCKGNALKYLMRANYKNKHDEDLKKADWYLSKEIEQSE